MPRGRDGRQLLAQGFDAVCIQMAEGKMTIEGSVALDHGELGGEDQIGGSNVVIRGPTAWLIEEPGDDRA